MDNKELRYDSNSEAVQAHLEIMQQVIQRMASNSESSKAWCITLVSAILVIVVDKGKPNYVWITIIPTVLFFILDSYYLSLEKGFRDSYNSFVSKIHAKKIEITDLFVVKPLGSPIKNFPKATLSFSILPFYITLLLMIYIAKSII